VSMSARPIPSSGVIIRGPARQRGSSSGWFWRSEGQCKQVEPERILVASRSVLTACALDGRERPLTAGGGTDVEKSGFSLTALPAAIRMTDKNVVSYTAEIVTEVPAGMGCRDPTSPIAFAQMLHGLARRISPGPEMGVRPKPMAIELPSGQ
jgi:hypothetical protein